MMNKTVFMILTNGFDPDVRVYKEAKFLVKKGFNVTILCWDRKKEYLEKEIEILEGINIKRFYISSVPGSGLKQTIPFIKFIAYVRNYLKDKEYQYLHCHDFDGIVAGMFTKNKRNKEIIFDMHEIYSDYSYGKNKLFNFFYKKIIRKVNHIICVNDIQIKNIENKEKIIYLPNYPDKQLYIPLEKKYCSNIRVNYIGSVRDYNALKKLENINIKNVEIGIYGIGTCYDKLLKEIKNPTMRLYGKYNGITEIGEIYRNTDILYCSYNPDNINWKNAYPVKLYESIITLTPVIVTENTIAGEFVKKNGIGEVVQYGQESSIINAINNIIENYDKYIYNLSKISNNYSWENIRENLLKIYRIN